MQNTLLILDLDDTLFETGSMDMALFDPARAIVEEYTLGRFGEEKSDRIIEEIKKTPFDLVAKRHGFPANIVARFYQTIQSISYKLDIEVYEDYRALRELTCQKYLVTTGMTALQEAKINALEIASDFVQIFVDDPSDKDRLFKKGIFQHIIRDTDPNQVWVIGDNPDSELKAGKELALKTIQRLKQDSIKSEYAGHSIRTFYELEGIIR